MRSKKFSTREYKQSDRTELLKLLLALHQSYFSENASKKLLDLAREHDIHRSYNDYVTILNRNSEGDYKTFVTLSPVNKMIGFIIGRIAQDDALVRNKIGILEDWFVEEEFRGNGIGHHLYETLEKWFEEKGCRQVSSETWKGNALSIHAHKKLGFFVSGISFSKLIG